MLVQLRFFHFFCYNKQNKIAVFAGRYAQRFQKTAMFGSGGQEMGDVTQKRTPQEWRELFSSQEFEDAYEYQGDDLGAVYQLHATDFALWAPTAERVELLLYRAGSAHAQGGEAVKRTGSAEEAIRTEHGVFRVHRNGDLNGIYYTWLVTADGQTQETADPYGKAAGVNGLRSMVIDLKKAEPEGWKSDREKLPKVPAPVVWEVHVGDFSNDPKSGVSESFRGKYKAFTENGTCLDKDCATCIGWLKWLGVTHVQILPMYDYGSVDETGTDCHTAAESCADGHSSTENGTGRQYNWGYDPVHYFVPEGSYATDPYHGEVRVRECREMIQALHRAGIRVIMDVVYNHTFSTDSDFQKTVPYYFYRQNADGSFSNGSACGNDTASERRMYRKYMIDCICYWAREYHIDGFRFDLMGLHDTKTMNAIRAALDDLPGGKEILMYGEPWAAGATAMQAGYEQALKCNAALLSDRIGFFNDDIRDSVKGSVFEVKESGFVNGANGLEERIRSSVLGFCDGAGGYQPSSALQSVSYVSAHDNYTLWDKLVHTLTDSMEPNFGAKDETVLAQNRLVAGIYFTCLGIPFLQAGEEAARTKYGDDNSYRSLAKVNQLDWARMYEYRELAEFYRGLILLRKSFPAWRQSDLNVLNQILFADAPKGCVAFTIRADVSEPVQRVITDRDAPWQELFIIYNASRKVQKFLLQSGKWQLLTDGTRFKIKEDTQLQQIKELEGSVWAEPVSVTILGR